MEPAFLFWSGERANCRKVPAFQIYKDPLMQSIECGATFRGAADLRRADMLVRPPRHHATAHTFNGDLQPAYRQEPPSRAEFEPFAMQKVLYTSRIGMEQHHDHSAAICDPGVPVGRTSEWRGSSLLKDVRDVVRVPPLQGC
jgi:hypothetical protein